MELVLTLHDNQVMLGPSHVRSLISGRKPDFSSNQEQIDHVDLHLLPSSPIMPGGHEVRWEDSRCGRGIKSTPISC